MKMEKYMEWHAELQLAIFDAKDKQLLKNYNEQYNLPISIKKMNKIDQAFLEFYKMFNGFLFLWNVDKKRTVGGRINFLKMEYVLQDWKGNLFDEQDIEENDLIEFFHPFDMITDESQCGIMLGTEYDDKEVYYNISGTSETKGLDLDFIGYLEMAKEAKVFNYWPKVILDIKNEVESEETDSFLKKMPTIFPEFNWISFKDKYESLRLSKKFN